ncbi:Phosphatase PAP2 family protein [Staphylococcus sp. 8AQ]|uniref:phosphatase PAP2 family protein n=1 Tax=Staphylococcus sp. 8AQ TaxID=2653174 RepID=UPI0012F34D91|nr:phosphatase PAP2 family protein [Staphylococcus sp. 8AQ]VXC94893.1 Phosphatase PAP2 family protein [Staphylococcus sp. 8AQ]
MINNKITTGKFTIPLFLISVCLFIFVSLRITHEGAFLKTLDLKSLHWLTQEFGTPHRNFEGNWFNHYMTFSATIGDVSGVIIMSLIITVVLMFRYKHIALWFILTILSGTLMNILIKMTIERTRPFNHLVVDKGYSFPSGHSNASTLLFVTMIFVIIPVVRHAILRYAMLVIAIILWLSILFCRLYFHAHYLTDVIGGVTLALAWIALWLAVYPLFKKLKLKGK